MVSSPVPAAIASPQAELPNKSEPSSSLVSRALDTKPEQPFRSRDEPVVPCSETSPTIVVHKSNISSTVEVPRSETRSPLPQVQPPSSSDLNRRPNRLKSSVAPIIANISPIPPPTTANLLTERSSQSSLRQNERSRSRSPLVPLVPLPRRSRSKSPPPVSNSSSGIRSRLGPIPTVVSKPSQSQTNRPFDQKRLAKRHSRSRSRSPSPKRRDVGPVAKFARSGTVSTSSATSSSSPNLTASSASHTTPSASTATSSSPATLPTSRSKSSDGTPLIDTPGAHFASPRRQRCRDYDERGFCLAGEYCPFDHGNDGILLQQIHILLVFYIIAKMQKILYWYSHFFCQVL